MGNWIVTFEAQGRTQSDALEELADVLGASCDPEAYMESCEMVSADPAPVSPVMLPLARLVRQRLDGVRHGKSRRPDRTEAITWWGGVDPLGPVEARLDGVVIAILMPVRT